MTDTEFLLELNDETPTEPPPELVSEYIHNRRILPPGSPRPGQFDVFYSPFMIEIQNNMAPYSGVNRTSVMKGVQITATTGAAENPMAYYMDACPAEIMYCSGTTDLLEKWTKRLEPLIDSCGFRHKIAAQVENTKSRKTGDKMYSKEYSGGSLSMVSLQAPAAMRSESNQILIVDEVDSAPAKTITGEGNFLGVLEGRTAAYGSKYKIMELSTPTTYELSVIHKQFLAGDQRYYNMPCPRCGGMIVFEFDQLRPVNNEHGHLESVHYECQECKGVIQEHEKTWMMDLDRAEWIATTIPRDPNHRSYHVNALYSPVGMLSWKRIYGFYLEAEEDPDRKPSFVNLYLGLPYKEEGHRPDINKVISLRGSYSNGVVPDDVVYLTMAADVQRGAEKYQKMSPEVLAAEIEQMKSKGVNLWKAKLPRIEMEVMGVGLYHKTWSVDYRVFYGHTTGGSYAGAFEKMMEWAEGPESGSSGMVYQRGDGVKFPVLIAMMDASDGVTQPSVFDFCSRLGPNVYPNVNDGWLKKKKDPGVDEETSRNYDRYRIAKKGTGGSEYIQISTNHYKKKLYSGLNIHRGDFENTPPGFCEFPRDRADYYFDMLTAEEQRPDGSFHNGGRPAEALDCRVYNLCAADVWLESQVRTARDKAKSSRYSENDIKKIDKKWFLNKMVRRLLARAA